MYTIVVENKSGETYAKGVLADKLDTANVVFDDEYGPIRFRVYSEFPLF